MLDPRKCGFVLRKVRGHGVGGQRAWIHRTGSQRVLRAGRRRPQPLLQSCETGRRCRCNPGCTRCHRRREVFDRLLASTKKFCTAAAGANKTADRATGQAAAQPAAKGRLETTLRLTCCGVVALGSEGAVQAAKAGTYQAAAKGTGTGSLGEKACARNHRKSRSCFFIARQGFAGLLPQSPFNQFPRPCRRPGFTMMTMKHLLHDRSQVRVLRGGGVCNYVKALHIRVVRYSSHVLHEPLHVFQ